MRHKNYIPQNIHDIKAIEYLNALPFEAIKSDVPKLLEWLQDGHWDVAQGIAQYLIPYINEITQELMFVLDTDDGMWKYFVICGLLQRSRNKLDPSLIQALRQIAEHPSNIDAEDGVDEVAKLIITNKQLCG